MDGGALFQQMYQTLAEHRFDLYLIDKLLAPRGFWGHRIGVRAATDNRITEQLGE